MLALVPDVVFVALGLMGGKVVPPALRGLDIELISGILDAEVVECDLSFEAGG